MMKTTDVVNASVVDIDDIDDGIDALYDNVEEDAAAVDDVTTLLVEEGNGVMTRDVVTENATSQSNLKKTFSLYQAPVLLIVHNEVRAVKHINDLDEGQRDIGIVL